MKILYLYGFASGPQSDKALYFKEKFSNLVGSIDFKIYDYTPNEKSFTNMKTSVILENLKSYIQRNYQDDLILFGSSFGALLAFWYANLQLQQNKVSKLILMAPALRFNAESLLDTLNITTEEWKKQEFVLIDHYRYGEKIPLKFDFYKDLKANPPPNFQEIDIAIPTLILHAKNDEICPVEWSMRYAKTQRMVQLQILDGDHQLLNQKDIMWKFIKKFLSF
ncbi:MAG: YqiA/YcfP family alpha/beta fold hydrolase [Candidatus Hodarchaeota archaeon]